MWTQPGVVDGMRELGPNLTATRHKPAYVNGVQTLFTVIGILGLVFMAFAALFVASLLFQLAMRPLAPKLAKKYDHLKAMMPAGPPREGRARVMRYR